jgi:enoyl-CoA hydratase/carnithine racemase
MTGEVLCALDGGIATVTLNRPAQRNAMNTALLSALRARFEELDANRNVRVVVVRGAGPAFCAGMDLKEMEARRGAQGDPESGVIEVLRRVEGSRHPTIAMVHGDAIAGGCELALHCDLRVASDAARFGMPLARIGLVVPFTLGQKLVEVIGPAHTRHLLFTGQPIDAKRALEIGMVHQVVGSAELEAATHQLAHSIARNAPLALAGIKATILRAVSLRESIPHADLDEASARARQSADASEGRRAMLEKRRPVFRGE